MLAEKKYGVGYESQLDRRRVDIENDIEKRRALELSDRKKRRTIFQFLLIGVMFIMFVVGAAYASSLAYGNNAMVEENEAINSNIQELKVQIQSTMNIGMVENVALKELGMIYPTESQIVQLSNEKDIKDFSEVLRKEAFK